MMLPYDCIRPFLFSLKPETAHRFVLSLLRYLPKGLFKQVETKPLTLWGIRFPNRVGLAAGLDNNGDYIDALSKLGFGFMEFGGVTLKPQSGNPRPRLFRLKKDKALINRMGFDNKGVDYLVERLKHCQYDGVIGVNIAKNKDTPNEKAIDDYKACFEKLYPHVSYITFNISSPNTPGLRALQHGELLHNLFHDLKQTQTQLANHYQKYVPMLVKLAPDLSDEALLETVGTLEEAGVDGLVFSNTTLARNNLTEKTLAKEQGGLSGRPLYALATSKLARLSSKTSLPIIGLGGIFSGTDAKGKLDAGASLVQVYSGLIYQGPNLVCEIVRAL